MLVYKNDEIIAEIVTRRAKLRELAAVTKSMLIKRIVDPRMDSYWDRLNNQQWINTQLWVFGRYFSIHTIKLDMYTHTFLAQQLLYNFDWQLIISRCAQRDKDNWFRGTQRVHVSVRRHDQRKFDWQLGDTTPRRIYRASARIKLDGSMTENSHRNKIRGQRNTSIGDVFAVRQGGGW